MLNPSVVDPNHASAKAPYSTMEPGSIRDRSKEQRKALVAQFVGARNVRKVPGVQTSRRAVFHAFIDFCENEGAAAFKAYREATGNSFRPNVEDVFRDLKALLGPLPSWSYHGGHGKDWGRCVPLQLDMVAPMQDPSSIDVLPVFKPEDHQDLAGGDLQSLTNRLCDLMVKAECAVDRFGRLYRFDGTRWTTTTEASFRDVIERTWTVVFQKTLRPREYDAVAPQIVTNIRSPALHPHALGLQAGSLPSGPGRKRIARTRKRPMWGGTGPAPPHQVHRTLP